MKIDYQVGDIFRNIMTGLEVTVTAIEPDLQLVIISHVDPGSGLVISVPLATDYFLEQATEGYLIEKEG